MWKVLPKPAAPQPRPPRSCPGCGCPLADPLWRTCPRCRRELDACAGCVGCGGCGKR